MDWIGFGSAFTSSLWIGLDWVTELMDWIGLDLENWTHVQLCLGLPTYIHTQAFCKPPASAIKPKFEVLDAVSCEQYDHCYTLVFSSLRRTIDDAKCQLQQQQKQKQERRRG